MMSGHAFILLQFTIVYTPCVFQSIATFLRSSLLPVWHMSTIGLPCRGCSGHGDSYGTDRRVAMTTTAAATLEGGTLVSSE